MLAICDRHRSAKHRILLSNPLLDFDELLFVRGGMRLAANYGGANILGNEIAVLSPVSPDGKTQTIYDASSVSSFELDWNAEKILLSDGKSIMEMDVDGSNLRVIKGPDDKDPISSRFDPCRLPNGEIMFASTACLQAVPCTGKGAVSNMHVMSDDGSNERRITFDQDHNWNPCLLPNGRVLYSRWEYTDIPHFFSRLLMHMNPDGTDQKEFYGSNSYWPNSMFWPRPIPGSSTTVVTTVTGHHGTNRAGELLIFDRSKGRHEADGVVQRIPGYGEEVEPIIKDKLVENVWPLFATPWPLGTSPEKDGAGKYFLATVKRGPYDSWELCLVDVFDNITTIVAEECAMPVPVLARPKPPVVPSQIDRSKSTANVMIYNIYAGPGLKGIPSGSVKALRVGMHHYRYNQNEPSQNPDSPLEDPGSRFTGTAYRGTWDVKQVLGTVPVHEDGSAYFEVPANTPLFIQPLDAEGKALQIMRSWFTALPGETLSCIGCHESQSMSPPTGRSLATSTSPSSITPWHGPARGFSFEREIQPVLDHRCVGCHDGREHALDLRSRSARGETDAPKQKGKRSPVRVTRGKDEVLPTDYSPSYMALQAFVRRPGKEPDYHMQIPAEWGADTSELVQRLRKGHHNVGLAEEEWGKLFTWIDYNIPYAGNWTESSFPPNPEMVEIRKKLMEAYACIDDCSETQALPPLAGIPFEAPPDEDVRRAAPIIEDWPFDIAEANKRRDILEDPRRPKTIELNLANGVRMTFSLIPSGEYVMGDADGFLDEMPKIAIVDEPFYLAATEVTLRQYHLFDPGHENGYVSCYTKQNQTSRGVLCMDEPDYPVVRISQQQAEAFCKWLSEETGLTCSLPTEEQWEWACRAGSSSKHPARELKPNSINIAGEEFSSWWPHRYQEGYSDGFRWVAPVGTFDTNTWGLYDMLGNVSEWTSSDYKPCEGIGTMSGTRTLPLMVVRGGSWNDRAQFATASSRWRYPSYQPVHNVGFRVAISANSENQIANVPSVPK